VWPIAQYQKVRTNRVANCEVPAVLSKTVYQYVMARSYRVRIFAKFAKMMMSMLTVRENEHETQKNFSFVGFSRWRNFLSLRTRGCENELAEVSISNVMKFKK
jgi:hypothetical protein